MRRFVVLLLIGSAAAADGRQDLSDTYLARGDALLTFETASDEEKKRCADAKAEADAMETTPDGGSKWWQWQPALAIPPAVKATWFRVKTCINDERKRRQAEVATAAAERHADMERVAEKVELAEMNEAQRMARDKKWQLNFVSAQVCSNQQKRSAALAEIATQKKYSKLGGVVDLQSLKDLQDQVREADDGVVIAQGNAKALRLPRLLPCSTARVAAYAACLKVKDVVGAQECDTDVAREMLRAEAAFGGD